MSFLCYLYICTGAHLSSWKDFGALNRMLFSFYSAWGCETYVIVTSVCGTANKGMILLPVELANDSPSLPFLVPLSLLAATFLLLFFRHIANKVIPHLHSPYGRPVTLLWLALLTTSLKMYDTDSSIIIHSSCQTSFVISFYWVMV